MTLARLWAFLAVGLPVLAAFIADLSSVDLAYHVRAGEMILDTGRIPTTDTWSFTAAGSPWLNQQWGAQLILGLVYRLAGWTGLVLLRAGLVGLTFGFLFEACRRRGLDLRRAAWLTLGAFVVSAVALALRPQLLAMALLALTLLLVADRRAHPDRLWAVPLIVLVWANVHGSFFLGPVVLGLAWLEDVHDGVPNRHRLLLLAVVSAAIALVNPFGIGVWTYAIGLSTNPFVTQRISEWQPTTLRTVPGMLLFGSVAAVIVLIARRARLVAWPTLASLGTFASIGVYAIRGVAWWPLGAAVAVAGLIAGPSERPRRPERSTRLNVAIAGLIVIACILLLPIWRSTDARVRAPAGVVGEAPPGITEALRSIVKPGAHILNPQPWGSWFEFALPDAQIAIDSRIEVFPAGVWDELDAVRKGGQGWQQSLVRWNVAIVVAEHDEGALVSRLLGAGWRQAYADNDGSILTAP
jgi:hypothetical protein